MSFPLKLVSLKRHLNCINVNLAILGQNYSRRKWSLLVKWEKSGVLKIVKGILLSSLTFGNWETAKTMFPFAAVSLRLLSVNYHGHRSCWFFFLKKGVPNTTRHRYTGMSFYRDFSKCLHYKNGKFKLNFYTSHGKENENVRRNLCYTCDHESINQKTLAK